MSARRRKMNNMQFMRACAKDPTWEDTNVRTVSMDFIRGSEESLSQIRQGGIDNSHLSELQDSIIMHGQQVPITIEDTGTKSEDGQTVYKLIDGGHRYLAISKLRKKNGHDLRWSLIRANIKQFANDFERTSYQIEANDHTLPSKNNTNEDAALWLNDVVNVGISGAPAVIADLHNSMGRNKTDPDGYEKDLKAAVSQQYPNMGMRRRNAVVKKFLSTIPGKFRTWDSEKANMELRHWVDESANTNLPDEHVLISIRETNHVFHNSAGNSLSATLENSNKNVVAVVWTNKTNGKTVKDIDEARIETIRKINQLNYHPKLGRGKKLVDRVFIAPQKLDGTTSETGFYEVPVNSGNGNFTLSIATKGWDTSSV